MRTPSLLQLAGIAAVWLVLVYGLVFTSVRTAPTGTTRADVEAALAHLRGALDGRPLPAPPAFPQPLALTVWVDGQRAACLQDADPAALSAALVAIRPTGGRVLLQLDAAEATGPLPGHGLLHGLGLVEGRDGVLAGGTFLPPSDLVAAEAYGALRPVPIAPELQVGVDPARTRALLARRAACAGLPAPAADAPMQRARALTLVETADGPRRLIGALTERPAPDREALLSAAEAAADYLARGQDESGRFRYAHHPVANTEGKGYGWLRHAGVCYGLSEAAIALDRPDLAEAAERGLELFRSRLKPGPDGSLCFFEAGDCDVGDSAVALAAYAAHREATGSTRFAAVADGLARFLVAMQKPEGFFHYDWSAERGFHTQRMRAFEAQESAFGLAFHGRVAGDAAVLDAAERALDHLSGPYWDHLTGRWVLGQEHWTCIAAAELGKSRPRRSHAEFCHRVGTFYARLTLDPVDTPFAEDAGGIGLSHGMGVHMGATATVQEALVGARAVSLQHGLSTADIDRALALGSANLVGHQVTAADTFWIADPDGAVGGVYDARTRPWTRMDNVQHALTALLGAAEP